MIYIKYKEFEFPKNLLDGRRSNIGNKLLTKTWTDQLQ